VWVVWRTIWQRAKQATRHSVECRYARPTGWLLTWNGRLVVWQCFDVADRSVRWTGLAQCQGHCPSVCRNSSAVSQTVLVWKVCSFLMTSLGCIIPEPLASHGSNIPQSSQDSILLRVLRKMGFAWVNIRHISGGVNAVYCSLCRRCPILLSPPL